MFNETQTKAGKLNNVDVFTKENIYIYIFFNFVYRQNPSEDFNAFFW
jgi:hypothetical protein